MYHSPGVSTSGCPNKHAGRVGDSPLPGSGLYAGIFEHFREHVVTSCFVHLIEHCHKAIWFHTSSMDYWSEYSSYVLH